ncbi:unnamed protein product [Dicrocoelium dendriticum]|nr:unnamed protein product [Dicrocoelium dendriticum]
MTREVYIKGKGKDVVDKEKQPEKVDLCMLEEDDEFEEFAAHPQSGDLKRAEEATVWEDNWDDDIVDDEFAHQLRAEFEKQGTEADSVGTIAPLNSDLCDTLSLDFKHINPHLMNGFGEHLPNVNDDPVITASYPSEPGPLMSTVLTSSRGFWKLECLQLESDVTQKSSDVAYVFSSSSGSEVESDEEQPRRKRQPLLRPQDDDSSSEQAHDWNKTEHRNSENSLLKALMQKRPARGRPPKLAQHSSLVSCARLRAERVKLLSVLKLKKLSSLKSLPSVAAMLVDRREPWAVGELVWARPKHPTRLPWWPGIVVQRPRKPQLQSIRMQLLRGNYESSVPEFRICLLGPITPGTILSIPQTRLRLYNGSSELGSFMRDTVLSSDDRVKALRQFVIQPSLQPAWHLAKEAADAARLAKPDSSGRLSLFPLASEARFQELGSTYDRRRMDPVPQGRFSWSSRPRKRVRPPGGSLSPSENSDSSESESATGSLSTENRYAVSSTASTGSAGPGRPSKFRKSSRTPHLTDASENGTSTSDTKSRPGFSLKELASSFEFEKLRFMNFTSRRIFVCAVCGGAGEQAPVQSSNQLDADSLLCKKSQLDPTLEDAYYPIIVACFGGCGNYLHPNCARTVTLPPATKARLPLDEKAGVSSECPNETSSNVAFGDPHPSDDPAAAKSVPACDLCIMGIRRCFICNLTQPCAPLIVSQITSTAEVVETEPGAYDVENHAAAPGCDPTVSAVEMHVPDANSISTATTTGSETEATPSGGTTDDDKTCSNKDQMIRCSVKPCHRWFHPSCLRKPPFSVMVRDRRAGAFSCPSHTCLACAVESPGTIPRPAPRYVQCFLCPAAYHPGDWCLPAGSKELAPNWIICPRHALDDCRSLTFLPPPLRIPIASPTLATMFRPTNVSWCFICSKGGRIICCETCPASFHEECLKIDEVPDKFVCEDCVNGRFPRYGEIVWARLPPNLNSSASSSHAYLQYYTSLTVGVYWWPGEVVHPRHLAAASAHSNSESVDDSLPYQVVGDERISRLASTWDHSLGLFPIRLFGLTTKQADTDDQFSVPIMLWTTRARLFPYEEGDDKRESNSSSGSSSDEEDANSSFRRRSSCLDDGEDEDPLLQLNASHCSASRENHEPLSPKKIVSSPAGSPLQMSPQNVPNLRPRSARCQRLRPGKESRASKRTLQKGHTTTDPVLVAQRKQVYDAAVKQAADGWSSRREKFGQLSGRKRRPDYYKPIKVNWPLGSVRVYRLSDPSEAPRCECKPDPSGDPCGPTSSCINRELHYECLPSVCPNGDACRNQRFTKRLYPAQRPFWTGSDRGWGLKTLVPINSGEFVNEYIGDLIDEEEANRRLRFAHENNVTNYYMMKLDSQRIIDAGPKGNLSRFMNHSCDPNLNTQKWTVNGDNRIGLFAVRDISPGEELTFNYNFVALGQERLSCRCGASNCVGFLGASASTNGTNNRGGDDDDSATANNTSRAKRNAAGETVGDFGKTHGPSDGSKSGTLACNAGGFSGRHNAQPESILSRAARHEHVCFRCGDSHPPKPFTMDELDDIRIKPSGILVKPQPPKRGLERELKELVADAINCSPIKDPAGRISNSTRVRSRFEGVAESSENGVLSDLIYCSKSDCTKVYHLQCLDLNSPPIGRWFCPWHHCDACGRPSHVFCCMCPSSFCLAHAEGSIAVLPPSLPPKPPMSTRRSAKLDEASRSGTKTGASELETLLVRVVCMSHNAMIRKATEEAVTKAYLTSSSTRKPLSPVDVSSNSLPPPATHPFQLRTRRQSDFARETSTSSSPQAPRKPICATQVKSCAMELVSKLGKDSGSVRRQLGKRLSSKTYSPTVVKGKV